MSANTTMSSAQQMRIVAANNALSAAEIELERAMHALSDTEPSTRADKTIITQVLKSAFEKLASAKENLAVVLGHGSGD